MAKKVLIIGSEGLIGTSVKEICQSNDNILYTIDLGGKASEYHLNLSENSEDDLSSFIERIFNIGIDGIVDCSYYRPRHWGLEFHSLDSNNWNDSLKSITQNLETIFYKYLNKNELNPRNIVLLGSIYGSLCYDEELYSNTDLNPAPEYLVTKSAIEGLTRLLAQEGSKCNILVNCICPGGIYNNQNPEFVEKYSKKTLLNRMAKAKDVSSIIYYFLTQNTYITGQKILVDGGYSIK